MVINSVRPSDPCLSSVVLLKKMSAIRLPSWYYNEDKRKYTILGQIFLSVHFLFLYNVSHFDRMCFESHLSLSLDHFVQNYPLTIVISNKMNSVLSVLSPPQRSYDCFLSVAASL